MATFKQYEKKDGSKWWMFKVHLGTDYVTKKEIKTTRRGFKTKKEAQLELNKLLFEFENDAPKNEQKTTTINEMYNLWFDTYKDTVKETTYRQTDRRMKEYVLPVFGDMIIERITPKFAQREINKWAEKFGMYTALLTYLIKVCDYAVMLEVVESNPFRKIVKPKRIAKKSKKKLKYYTSSELRVFLESTEKRLLEAHSNQPVHLYYSKLDVALFRLLAFSGIRIGECLSLYWSDLDFDKNTLSISKSLTQVKGGYEISTTKTFSSVRTITLDHETLATLRKWKLEQAKFLLRNGFKNDKNLLFTDWKGKLLSHPNINGRSRRIAEYANLPCIGLHGFRHTHATLLFESGVSPKEIQHRLGHSDISMTLDTYTHVTEQTERKAINTLMEHFGF
ncbi:site-specific integrase [Vagococcus xieshaowenii]|uniref:Site-specific integrase n=1 Tax=Vagococcus xieshaowenii TaxID=2562451 RepID=A0A4Z0DAF3_9ENTE|nr:site-specific integrase [Vagococcus xieshaowenii]QCA28222.1 site-specific integrase [Vagococcus xieshaowenii]TFZ41877.1 site-specific integrase [Vagococcus xieshaowenii]